MYIYSISINQIGTEFFFLLRNVDVCRTCPPKMPRFHRGSLLLSGSAVVTTQHVFKRPRPLGEPLCSAGPFEEPERGSLREDSEVIRRRSVTSHGGNGETPKGHKLPTSISGLQINVLHIVHSLPLPLRFKIFFI